MNNINLPYSLEAEQATINALLTDAQSLYAIEKISTDDFYTAANALIFKAIKDLHEQDKPIDLVAVNEELKKADTDKAFQNTAIQYINDIMLKLYPTQGIEYYIEILKDKSLRRKIIKECRETITATLESKEDPAAIKAGLSETLDQIRSDESDESDRLYDVLSEVFDELENFDEEELRKYYTGIPDLDNLTHGLHKSEVTVLAGRPGTGKTAMAVQIAMKLAGKGLKVLFISREMSQGQIAKRILTTQQGIEGKKLRGFKITSLDDWTALSEALVTTSNLPIYINTRAKTIPSIKSKIRETKADVLIIDYLQLLEPSSKHTNREREVAELSREIKNISLDFKIPVLLLSQLNRLAATRKPNLADLRESGAIEQDANTVLLLYRPTPEKLQEFLNSGHDFINRDLLQQIKSRGNELIQAIVAKQRDGETGEFYLEFKASKLTFLSYDRHRSGDGCTSSDRR